MINNTTPPGDGLAEFYGWAKAIDGEVLVKFFNEMCIYAEPGYQDRLNILGKRGGWVFNMVFSEKGVTTSLPTVSISLGESFPGSRIFEQTIPRPSRLTDETYADLTTRWLQMAYSALIGFNIEAGNPFTFNTGSVWYVDPDLSSPSDVVLVLQDDWGIASEVWTTPAQNPWVGSLTGQSINLLDATIDQDGRARLLSSVILPLAGTIVIQLLLESYSGFVWIPLWDDAGTPYPALNQEVCVVFSDGYAWIPGYPVAIASPFDDISLSEFEGYVSRITLFDTLASNDMAVFLSLNPQ